MKSVSTSQKAAMVQCILKVALGRWVGATVELIRSLGSKFPSEIKLSVCHSVGILSIKWANGAMSWSLPWWDVSVRREVNE